MRDDIPAALPLIFFATALAVAPLIVHPQATLAGFLCLAVLLTLRGAMRAALLAVIASAGLTIGETDHARRIAEQKAMAAFGSERFVGVIAPIEGDWSQRLHVHVLRSSRFLANGLMVDAPLAIYARFEPPRVQMEATVRAEGHLRPDRRGGYTMSLKSPRLLRYDGMLSHLSPRSWNRVLANRLREHAPSRPGEIAMIEALLLGRGERLAEQTKEDFKRGGTYHLLVFSGLQISVAAGVIAMLLRWIGAARAADWSLLAFSLIAPAFIGNEASVSRASTAIALYAISRIAKRPTTFENLWCIAAMMRLALEPADLFEPAFHLTYAGAGALLFIGRPLSASPLRFAAYAIAAEIAIAPFTLFHFHQYALGGSLTTIAMTPVVFVMLLAGGLFSATEMPLLLDLIAFLNMVCTAMNRAASPASGFFAAPSAISIVMGVTTAAAALALLRGRARTSAVVVALLIPALTAIVTFHRRSNVHNPMFVALDVGQGDALLLRSGSNAILVDGGGRRDDARFGESVLLPLLLDRGVRELDTVILSHAHPDHCGGLAAAIRHLTVREVWISPRRFRGECAQLVLDAVRSRAVPIRILRGGESFDLGGLAATVTILRSRFRRAPENNNSVIVAAQAGERTILLTGDIERDAERELAGRIGSADVLKIPHHGSRTSTSDLLLDAVRPRIAVLSCGRDNFFGHPHPSVVAELRRRRIRLWRTDLSGTVEMTFRIGSLEVRTEN